MRYRDHQEYMQAVAVRKMTGRSFQACLFCLRVAHGNVHRATEICKQEPASEGGR
jgi:hypothetical protein